MDKLRKELEQLVYALVWIERGNSTNDLSLSAQNNRNSRGGSTGGLLAGREGPDNIPALVADQWICKVVFHCELSVVLDRVRGAASDTEPQCFEGLRRALEVFAFSRSSPRARFWVKPKNDAF